MNKTALVTGATGGIGEAICFALAENGYKIIVHCFSNEEKGKLLCSKIEKEYNTSAVCIKADFKNNNDIKALARAALSFGDVEVLVNNAAISHTELFQLVSDEKSKEIFTVNAESAMLLTKEILPHMINKHSGKIINISSMWGVTGGSCEVHYSASKAALIGFTKALSKEVGPSNITVNCIAPGLIDTSMNSHLSKDELQAVIDETPLSRIGTAQDVANLVSFLASEKASFITGQVIGVDGGLAV